MLIDCDTCAVRGVHCHDCVVSVFLTLPRAVTDEPGALGPSARRRSNSTRPSRTRWAR